MRRYPLYIFDLDGTLYRGSEALPGVAETLHEIRRWGSTVRFLTNNSSQTPESQAQKLTSMGILADPSEVLTSAMGAARFMSDKGLSTAFVVGEPGLAEILQTQGIQIVEKSPDAVVAGICRSFTYEWLNQAMQHLLGGARFLATNTDASYPMEQGRLVPGAGAIVAALQTCSGVTPTVIGKPNTYLLDLILRGTGTSPTNALVVGDRYETDIVSGVNAGCDTLLVLTGVTRQAPAGQPNANSIVALLD